MLLLPQIITSPQCSHKENHWQTIFSLFLSSRSEQHAKGMQARVRYGLIFHTQKHMLQP